MPGKQIRSRLTDAINLWLRIPNDKLSQIEQIVEMLHNASLLYIFVLLDTLKGLFKVQKNESKHKYFEFSKTIFQILKIFLKKINIQIIVIHIRNNCLKVKFKLKS